MALKSVIFGLVALGIAGCSSKPLPPITAEQQNFRKQELKLMFARLISRHLNFGTTTLLGNRREYSNALVNVPPRKDSGLNVICTKVRLSSFGIFGPATVDLSARIIERPKGTTLSMGRDIDLFPACSGPYEPYPELEALSPKEPA